MDNTINISSNPVKECDIIMKGGITSGIVYPKAINELAKTYKFSCIGGTSAGAIASGLTAAAEYRRKNGSIDGFKILDSLPKILTEKDNNETRLLSLFQPNDKTRKYYNTLLPFLNEKGGLRKGICGLWEIIKSYPFISLLLILLFGLNEYLFITTFKVSLIVLGSVLNILSLILFLILSNTIFFLINLNKDIKDNNFGLTKGFLSDTEKKNKSKTPLTEWLADLIDEVAGKDLSQPLTFGDLYDYEKNEGINLKMVTTNLNHGIPNTLPFKKKNKSDDPLYYFKENEFREYFPKRIVDWMVKNSEVKDGEYLSLPDAERMPVIVGVRMSLSFPVLISAVPIHKKNIGESEVVGYTKCLFSDGGICSNFPVHFFDSPLPTRPTFAINLRQFETSSSDQSKNISMPEDNKEGLDYEFNKNEGSLISFIGSITKTMQNWNDNTQIRIPGFRDRICTVFLTKDEGGMNLNMDESFIRNICERGTYAGIELRERFSRTDYKEMNWDNHKWIRLRTSIALLQKYLKDMQEVYDNYPYSDEMSYTQLLNRAEGENPDSYKMGKNQSKFVNEELEKIFAIVRNWDLSDNIKTFAGSRVPRPQPELRIKPKL